MAATKPTAGSALRAVREASGLSLQELAKLAGVDVGYLSRVERDLRQPSAHWLASVTRALGKSNG